MKYSFLFILVIVFLSNCSTDYQIKFKQNEISSMGIFIGTDADGLRERLVVSFPVRQYRNQLKNIDYIDGWVKIGNELFTFNKEDIYIRVITAPPTSRTLVNPIYQENGKINFIEEERVNILYDCIEISLNKKISKRDFNRIYNQKNNQIEAFFLYKLIVDDEIIEIIINETFTYEIRKTVYFLGEINIRDEIILE
jgi:hypothetical protein